MAMTMLATLLPLITFFIFTTKTNLVPSCAMSRECSHFMSIEQLHSQHCPVQSLYYNVQLFGRLRQSPFQNFKTITVYVNSMLSSISIVHGCRVRSFVSRDLICLLQMTAFTIALKEKINSVMITCVIENRRTYCALFVPYIPIHYMIYVLFFFS